jgi:hypothetical protein
MEEIFRIAAQHIANFINGQMRELPRCLAVVRHSVQDVSFVNSSRYVLALDEVCAEAISKRGVAVWESLHRCIVNGHAKYTDDLASKLKEFSVPYLRDTVGGLTTMASEIAARASIPYPGRQSEEARDHALSILETEIDHFCMALASAPQATPYQPPHVINVSGSASVASIQTGAHSSATVHFQALSQPQIDVAAALDQLKQEIMLLKKDDPSIFLIDETKAAAVAENPNPARLASFFNAAKKCISGALEAAPKIPALIDTIEKGIKMIQG